MGRKKLEWYQGAMHHVTARETAEIYFGSFLF